jgi:UDP-glucose 4-epimerase
MRTVAPFLLRPYQASGYLRAMSIYLVTGGCGFIGSNLVHALVAQGEQVRILDNLATGRHKNVAKLLSDRPGQVELWRGDILDGPLLDRVMRDVDYVLHLGAMPSVIWSVENPILCDRINSGGTLQVLEAARRQGKVKRVVIAASCAAYGDLRPAEAKREDHELSPQSPYSAAKLASEHHGVVYSRIYGVPTVSLRYFNIFGVRQDPTSQYAAVIPNFVRAVLQGRRPKIFGDGLQSRDFCYIDNVVSANLLACSARAEQVAGQIINIGCGTSVTLLELVAELGKLTGRTIEPEFLPAREGEVRYSLADIGKAKALLGYEPLVRFPEGLERTLRWFADRAEDAA